MDDSSADWCVECSDDEEGDGKYGVEGRWEPPSEEIVKLYRALANGEELILEWKCPGRRLPQTGKKSKPMNLNENHEKNSDEKSSDANAAPTSPTSGYEFDLDDAAGPVTPSRVTRIPGKTPKSAQKRVARFDRVINDINRQKLGSPVASPDSPSGTTTTASTTAATISTSTTFAAPTSTSASSNHNLPAKSANQLLQQVKLQTAPGTGDNAFTPATTTSSESTPSTNPS